MNAPGVLTPSAGNRTPSRLHASSAYDLSAASNATTANSLGIGAGLGQNSAGAAGTGGGGGGGGGGRRSSHQTRRSCSGATDPEFNEMDRIIKVRTIAKTRKALLIELRRLEDYTC